MMPEKFIIALVEVFQLNWIGLSNFCHSCYTWESMTLPPICSKEMPAKRWHWTLRKKAGQNRGPGFWRLWQKLCLAPRISPAKGWAGKKWQKEVFGALGHLSCRHGEHKPVEQFVRWGSTLKVITVACHPHLDMINTSSQFDLDPCTPRQCYLSDESSDGQCVSGGWVTFCDGGVGGGQVGAAGS